MNTKFIENCLLFTSIHTLQCIYQGLKRSNNLIIKTIKANRWLSKRIHYRSTDFYILYDCIENDDILYLTWIKSTFVLGDIIYFVLDNNDNISYKLYELAFKQKNTKMVIFLHKAHFPKDDWILGMACEHNNLEALKYLWKKNPGYSLCESSVMDAIRNENLEMVKYLQTKGIPFTEASMKIAVMRGLLNFVVYLHENNCSWDSNVLQIAVDIGFLDIVEYLDKNGCPWPNNTLWWDMKQKFLDTLMYVRNKGLLK